MFLTDLLVALAVGVLLTALFVAVLGTRGPWGVWWVFLLVVLLAAWVGGAWVRPWGPTMYDIHWVPFLFFGLIFALLLAAVIPSAEPARTPAEARERAQARAAAATTFSVFFWMLIIALMIGIVVAYI